MVRRRGVGAEDGVADDLAVAVVGDAGGGGLLLARRGRPRRPRTTARPADGRVAQATSSGPVSPAATVTDDDPPATNAASHAALGGWPTLVRGSSVMSAVSITADQSASKSWKALAQRLEQTGERGLLHQHGGRLQRVDPRVGLAVGGRAHVFDVDAVDLAHLVDQQREELATEGRRSVRRWRGRRPARGCRCRRGRPAPRRCGWPRRPAHRDGRAARRARRTWPYQRRRRLRRRARARRRCAESLVTDSLAALAHECPPA